MSAIDVICVQYRLFLNHNNADVGTDVLSLTVGVLIFSFLSLIGSATFAAGAFLRGNTALLPVMLLGRLLFGSGNGALTSQFCILLVIACLVDLFYAYS